MAIKKPLTYGVRRTTRRILSFIVTVWIASCLISIPPVLILGNEHGTPEQPICEVSQNRGYQLYATLGSFYIPLFVMIVMYYKIYVAAKRVVDAELRDQRPSSCTNQTSSLTLKSSMGKTRKTLSFKSSNRFYSIRKQSPSSTTTTTTAKQQQQQQLQQQQQINYFDPSMKKPSTTTTVQLLDKNQNYLLKQNDKTNHIRMKKKRKKRGQKFFRKYCFCCCGYNSCCCGCHCCQNSDYFDCGDDDDELSRQQNSNEIPVTTSTIITPAAIMVNSDGKTTTTSTTMLTVLTTPISTTTTTTSNDNHKHLNGHQKLGKKTLKQSPSPTTTTTTNFQSGFRRNRRRSFNNNTNTGSVLNKDGGTVLISGSGCSTTLAMKQRASNALRERKASVTLGKFFLSVLDNFLFPKFYFRVKFK